MRIKNKAEEILCSSKVLLDSLWDVGPADQIGWLFQRTLVTERDTFIQAIPYNLHSKNTKGYYGIKLLFLPGRSILEHASLSPLA